MLSRIISMENLNKGENVRDINLKLLIGQYALILETLHLSDEWRKAYEERLEDLKGELDESA